LTLNEALLGLAVTAGETGDRRPDEVPDIFRFSPSFFSAPPSALPAHLPLELSLALNDTPRLNGCRVVKLGQ
jgi:hypothetical protein